MVALCWFHSFSMLSSGVACQVDMRKLAPFWQQSSLVTRWYNQSSSVIHWVFFATNVRWLSCATPVVNDGTRLRPGATTTNRLWCLAEFHASWTWFESEQCNSEVDMLRSLDYTPWAFLSCFSWMKLLHLHNVKLLKSSSGHAGEFAGDTINTESRQTCNLNLVTFLRTATKSRAHDFQITHLSLYRRLYSSRNG